MTNTLRQAQIEFGDFQTPLELAKRVCQKLIELGVSPVTVIEPTCGVGAFVEASAITFPAAKKIQIALHSRTRYRFFHELHHGRG